MKEPLHSSYLFALMEGDMWNRSHSKFPILTFWQFLIGKSQT